MTFSTIILLFLCSQIGQTKFASATPLLAEAELSSLSYDEIHKLAVNDQIKNYQPAQKSLHTRLLRSLDGIYDFCFDEGTDGFAARWHSDDLSRSCRPGNFYRMPVPSAFNEITSNKTARNYMGWFWYQTTLDSTVPTTEDKQWFIQFESVNYLAIVWIQRLEVSATRGQTRRQQPAHFLGSHVGGHLPFKFEIPGNVHSLATSDKRARLRLTVAVSNMLTNDTIPSGQLVDLSQRVGRKFYSFEPDFDFFHFAGIMGSVRVLYMNRVHFSNIDVTSGPREISSLPPTMANNVEFKRGTSFASFNVCISDPSAIGYKYTLEASLFLNSNREKLLDQTTLDGLLFERCNLIQFHLADQGSQDNFTKSLEWQPANGKVSHYSQILTATFRLIANQSGQHLTGNGLSSICSFATCRMCLQERQLRGAAEEADFFELRFGIRDMNNNKFGNLKYQLQGFGLHHEQLFSGRTMSQSAILKDIYLLKQLGANIVRTSHYPYSSEFLDACDEHGIMVIGEAPAVGLKSFSNLKLALHKQILLEMMQRDHHHASIVMWSLANEPQSQLEAAQAYFEPLYQFARNQLAQYTVDAGRPLTAAIAQSHSADKIGYLMDVLMINRYFGWYENAGISEAIRLPLLESISGWAQIHPNKGIIVSEFGADTLAGLHSSVDKIFSEEFQLEFLLEYERVFDELWANKSSNDNAINFLGSMIWNLADFSTHNSLSRPGGNRKGLLTQIREPKLAFNAIKSIYLARLRH